MTATRRRGIVLFGTFMILALPQLVFGVSSGITVNTTAAKKIRMTVGKSLVIDDPGPGNIVFAAADENIVEVMRLPTGQVYLRGKKTGLTNLTVLEKKKVTAIFDIEVIPDVSRLDEKIALLFPEEKDILVSADNDWITLSGSVAKANDLSQILKLAQTYAPGKVVNLLFLRTEQILDRRIREFFPEETKVKVDYHNEYIILSGVVNYAPNRERIEKLARAFAEDEEGEGLKVSKKTEITGGGEAGEVSANLVGERLVLEPAPRIKQKKVINLLSVESFNASLLKEKIYEILPEENNVHIGWINEKLTLSGTVSSAANHSMVLSLAKSYAGKENVTSLLEIGGVQQVMLEVRVAEMSQGLGRRLGINFNYISSSGQNVGVTTLGDLTTNLTVPGAGAIGTSSTSTTTGNASGTTSGSTTFTTEGDASGDLFTGEDSTSGTGSQSSTASSAADTLSTVASTVATAATAYSTGGPISGEISSVVNAIFRFFGFDASWLVFIDALKETGLVKLLAEPTLITVSGQTASFLAGGEFPVPVTSEDGITIEYKPFGVMLSFTPTVLSNDKISLRVAPSVSDLDFTTGVATGGVAVPGLRVRSVDTTIELDDGQSFAIAGLLQHNVRELISKYPILGDIPVLGVLFRSTQFQKSETELVIIATAHLVKPLDMSRQPLPTDSFIEPDDFEFYLLGSLEGRDDRPTVFPGPSGGESGAEGGLEGEFGHIIPK